MTLDASGNLLVGTTTSTPASITAHRLVVERTSTVFAAAFGYSPDSTARTQVSFYNSNGSVGTISTSGSATAYNTSSDYRLKTITGPVTGSEAKDFIMALQPKKGTWKVDGSKFVGFLAHEFQEVSPSSVIGEKDAVDADGKPIMQAMQASSPEVMANLVALLQEQQAIIDAQQAALETLTNRISALENK
jgi:hypothetical protein